MSTANQDQIAFWNANAGAQWVGYQRQLDHQLGVLGEAMLALADIRPGQRVLDIGCGCGQTSLQAATLVGAGGSVTGVDVSVPMLAHARERARQTAAGAAGHADFVVADAQTDPLGNAVFDRAISRFGVMFFADPVVAFTNIRTALKADGRVAFVCWRGMADNPWLSEPMRAAARHVPLPPPPPPDAPGPLAFADPARVRRILGDAGFGAIDIAPGDFECPMVGGRDIDACVDFMFSVGPLSRIILGTDVADAAKASIRADVRDILLAYMTPAGLVMPAAVWLVSARVPEAAAR